MANRSEKQMGNERVQAFSKKAGEVLQKTQATHEEIRAALERLQSQLDAGEDLPEVEKEVFAIMNRLRTYAHDIIPISPSAGWVVGFTYQLNNAQRIEQLRLANERTLDLIADGLAKNHQNQVQYATMSMRRDWGVSPLDINRRAIIFGGDAL